MKKIIALALVLTMVFSMTLSVYAEDTTTTPSDTSNLTTETVEPGGSISGDINKEFVVKVTVNGEAVPQYAFDIIFGDMSFEYGDTLEWDPDELEYVPASGQDGTWNTVSENGNIVKIINRSDKEIWCHAEIKDLTDAFGEIRLTVTGGGKVEACSVNDTVVHEQIMTVSVSGAPNVPSATAQKLGSVVVTISGSEIVQNTSES